MGELASRRAAARLPRARAPRPRGSVAAALAALALAACGQDAPPATSPAAPSAAATPGAAPRTGARTTTATTSTGANPHDLYAQRGLSCQDCHPCGTRAPGGHGIAWMDTASPGFHAYAANASLASCQGCHGANLDGVGGTTSVSCAACHGASWRTSCTTCHGGANDASGAPPRTVWGQAADAVRVGAHASHLGASHRLAAPVTCESCHVKPADALSAGHADGPTADVAFSGLAAPGGGAAPTWSRASATCSNVYCHGATLAGGAQQAPVWTATDGSQRACGSCHGAPPPAPHTTSTACGSCHAGYTATSVDLATHIDGRVQVTSHHPAGWAAKAQHGYQANLTGLAGCKTCHGANLDGVGGSTTVSCTACHAAAGFSTWATSCTFCHGDRATGAQSPPVDVQGRSVATNTSVGRHATHASPTLSRAVACATCHPARTASVIADAAHVDGNGLAEVALSGLAATGTTAAYTRASATSGTCATYCHGSFTGGATTNRPSWTSTAAPTCTRCHAGPPSTGDHRTHQGRRYNNQAITCGDCHGAGYSSAAVNAALHVNGVKDVGGTGSRITTWTTSGTTKSCTPACHGRESW